MSLDVSRHPSRQQLADFALGRVDAEAADTVARHIESCETCCQALSSVSDDHITKLARNALQDAGVAEVVSGDTSPNSLGQTQTLDTAGGAADSNADVLEALQGHSRYRVLEQLGAGGMGEVYKAEHRLMGRAVALKVIRSQLTTSPTAVSRFRNEVRSAARLSHPNIVAAFDAENVGAIHFLVMEFVDGENLEEHVSRVGALPVSTALSVTRQVAAGLQHAFEHGMVHRDIKPQNLMLDADGRARILDFGLARFVHEEFGCAIHGGLSAGITAENLALGTPDYIAPEQASDARATDIRSDIYSLGCTLYFLLTGHPPFPSGSPVQKISSHLLLEPPALAQLRPDVPCDVAAVVEQMMAKSPEDRFQTPAELIQTLDQLETASLTATKGPQKRQHASRAVGMVIAVCFALVLAGVGLWSGVNWGDENQSSGTASPGAVATPAGVTEQPRVLFILPNQLSYPEFTPVRDVLQQAGVDVETAALRRQVFSADSSARPPFDADLLLAEVDPTGFDALVVVGGNMDELTNEGAGFSEVTRIVRQIDQQNGVVAGICLGLLPLSDADYLRGHRVAYNEFIRHEFEMNRATAVRELVCSDDRLVTAEGPEAAKQFAEAILEALGVP